MSKRVDVLLKEKPWLTKLHRLIGKANEFRVERLDITHLAKDVDHSMDGEFRFRVYGWFVTRNGNVLGKVHRSSWMTGLLAILGLARDRSSNGWLLAEVTRKVKDLDRVAYIVLIKEELDVHLEESEVSIHIFRIPHEESLSDLLKQHEALTAQSERIKASEQLRNAQKELLKL